MVQKQQSDNTFRIIFIIIAILAVFVAGTFFKKWHTAEITTTKDQEEIKYSKTIEKLKTDIDTLTTEIELQKDEILPSEEIKAVFDKPSPKADDCETMRNNVMAFFSYLDQKGYGNTSSTENGSYQLYLDSLERLTKNPPVFSDNSEEVLKLLRSMSHFYRVLGSDHLTFIKRVLTDEAEMLEPALASFYEWFSNAQKCKNAPAETPTLETLYNYSCFFLNTLAGKSYLMRRSSKIRILASYYSVLIIDKANDETLNQYGYDIRANIRLLSDDIENHRKLLYKKKYIDRLNEIARKYPQQTDN